MPGIRWRRCTGCWPCFRRSGCWCSTTLRTGSRCGRFCRQPGAGRVLITSQSAAWPRGQAVEVPVLDTEVAAGFLINRTGDPDRQAAAGAGGRAGRAAAGAGAGRRLYPGHRDHPGRVPVGVPGAPRRTCWPAAKPPGTRRTWRPPWGWRCPGWGARRPAAAGLLRLLACLAPEPVPLALLLTDVPVAGELAPGVAAMVGPLLGDPVAAGDAIAALRRYSLVTPAGDGLVLVHRLVQAVTLAQVSADTAGQWQQAAAALVEAAIPADTVAARGLAGVRGAAAARPGCPRPDQRRHVADRAVPRP